METICQWINEWRVWIFVPIIAAGLAGIVWTIREIWVEEMGNYNQ